MMFREMRRWKQQLSQEDCEAILTSEKRGVLSVNGDDGYPYSVPVNFLFDSESQSIYIHSALTGHKVDAINRDGKVCFTTWTKGVQQEGDWSFFVDSVIAFGRASFVEDEEMRRELTKRFGMKYYPSEVEVDAEIARDFPRMLLIRVAIESMTGKHVHER